MFTCILLQANVAPCSPLKKTDKDLISLLMPDVEVEIVKELERERETPLLRAREYGYHVCLHACLEYVLITCVRYYKLVWYILFQQGCVAYILYSYFSEGSVDFNIHNSGGYRIWKRGLEMTKPGPNLYQITTLSSLIYVTDTICTKKISDLGVC